MLPVMQASPPAQPRAPDPDAADVALAATGDVDAFERLYRRHIARINSLVVWMSGDRETEDILQEIFLRAWRKLETFRGASTFKTWLHQLAVNVILRHRERQRVREDRYPRDAGALAAAHARDDGLELYTEIEAAVATLSPRARDVFVLHDVEGYRHHEIAEMLAISANTSRWQLHHARAALRRLFA